MTKEQISAAIELAERGLSWKDHKDFTRVYVALEKVHQILLAASDRAIKW